MDATLSKVTLNMATLQDLVSRAVKCSLMHEQLPLTCVMNIIIKDNKLYVKTTDNINYVTATADVQSPDFEVTVNSKLFSDLVNKLNKVASVNLVFDGTKLTVEAGSGVYNIPIEKDIDGGKLELNPPTIQPNGSAMHLNSNEVNSLLLHNKCCKSENKEVPCLYNYYFDSECAITTDGNKCCYNPIKLSDRPIILTPNLVELIKTVTQDEYGVDICQDDTRIMFSSPVGELIGVKGVEADLKEYPVEDMKEASGVDSNNIVEINRTLFLEAVDRLSLFISNYERNEVDVTFSKDKLQLKCPMTNSEESITFAQPFADDFQPITFCLDNKELKNELTACNAEQLKVKFGTDFGIIIELGNVKLLLCTLS